jgi:magnesium transporter
MSNSTNSVMRVLTIIATIFIPLTFLAGVYGMNFTYMPKLNWRGEYFAVLGVMGLVGLLMFFLFKKRKWL